MKLRKELVREIILSIIGILITIIFLFPLLIIFFSSLKTESEIFSSAMTLLPKKIDFSSYIDQFVNFNIMRSFLNSFIIALFSTMLSLILSIPASYGLARFNVPFKKSILLVFLLTQLLPTSLILTPLFIMFTKLKIINSYLGPILSTATISIPFTILIMRTIFIKAPKELEEAGKIDGCTMWQIFLKIFLPISKPGLITSASFSFIMAWNDLIFSMTFNNNENLRPMTAGIYNFMSVYGTQWNRIMAYAVLLVLPVVIIFILLQKYIVGGLLEGSVKG
ncbi:carbohydrate ABC transporter permease [Brachyspira sp. SAP_772]|uniref:carbohydrate ABC transporter permease n=1 Tax=Brachyspira sp. SAP_772 TaxID=2608385 RepID=UPI0012F50520|nr:carbohydrate ABC transporter permease [Brachyspira sp. SAP_772]